MIYYIRFYFRTTSSWKPMIRRFFLAFCIVGMFLFLTHLQNTLAKEGQSYLLQEFGDTVNMVSQFILILLVGVIAVLLYCLLLDFVSYLQIIHLLGLSIRKIYLGLIEGIVYISIPSLISAEFIAVLLASGTLLIFPNFNIGFYLISTFVTCVVTLCIAFVLCVGILLLQNR